MSKQTGYKSGYRFPDSGVPGKGAGRVIENPTYVLSYVNTHSLYYDGTASGYVEWTDLRSYIDCSAAHSWVFWLKTTDTAAENIISAYNGGNNQMYIKKLASGNLQVYYRTTGTILNSGTISCTENLEDGDWHHIAVVMGSNPSTSNCAVYVDGVAQTVSWSGGTITNDLFGAATLRFGGNGDFSSYLDCYLDEVILCDKDLSNSEVTRLYNGGVVFDYTTDALYTSSPGIIFFSNVDGDTLTTVNDIKGTTTGTAGAGVSKSTDKP